MSADDPGPLDRDLADPGASAPTIHATALVVHSPLARAPRGVLVTGPSGSGKSAFALALMDEWRAAGRFAALVADDRTVLAARNGRLIAAVPPALAGLVEVRGLGLRRVPHATSAVMHLHVALGRPSERMPDPAASCFHGVEVPRIVAANAPAALPLLRARLLHAPVEAMADGSRPDDGA